MTPEIKSLLDAYVRSTGLAVSLSYTRQQTLSEIALRGITAEDVEAVIKELKRLLSIGAKGYGPTSLDFRNVMIPDTLEERALRLRQKARRTDRPLKAQDQAQAINTGNGVVSRIVEPMPNLAVNGIDVARSLRGLADDLSGRNGHRGAA